MSVVEKVKSEIIQPQKNNNGLLVANPVYKPFRYPWCYDAWLTQQRIHWLPEEVPLGDDVRDWQKNLSASEKNLLTQIFRFFTQADVEVSNCYIRHYMNVFKPTEVLMMQNQQMLLPMYINLKINKQIKNQNTRSVYHVSSRKNKNRKKRNNPTKENGTIS